MANVSVFLILFYVQLKKKIICGLSLNFRIICMSLYVVNQMFGCLQVVSLAVYDQSLLLLLLQTGHLFGCLGSQRLYSHFTIHMCTFLAFVYNLQTTSTIGFSNIWCFLLELVWVIRISYFTKITEGV